MQNKSRAFKLSLFATGLAMVVVMLGAYTRLVDAGLGCPDWPGCYGFLTVPGTAEQIAIAESRFPDSPVEHEKGWPEMIHRYFAGMLGLVILGLAVAATVTRHKGVQDRPFKLPLLLLVLVIWQALFGMWTVTLKLWPQVVTIHLLGGFATLSLLWLLTLRLDEWRIPVSAAQLEQVRRLKPWLLGGIAVLVTQIALGGWTASNYAAYACYDLPTCQGQWWPEMDFLHGFNIFQHVGPNYLGGLLNNEGRVAIHMAHRLGAIVTLLYLGGLVFYLWAKMGGGVFRKFAVLLGLMLGIQLLLGISNVLWHIPLAVAVAHNAGGALLLLTLILIGHRFYRIDRVAREIPARA